MNAYMAHFAVYLFAMVGIICVALFIVQKSLIPNCKGKKSSFLEVEDTITIAPKKSLFVIKAGDKKLLIASDEGRTTFLTNLDEKEKSKLPKSIEEMTSKLSGVKMYHSTYKDKKLSAPVMRSILTKLK